MNIKDLYPGKKLKFKDNPECDCRECKRLKGRTVTVKHSTGNMVELKEAEEGGSSFDERHLEEISYQLPEKLFSMEK